MSRLRQFRQLKSLTQEEIAAVVPSLSVWKIRKVEQGRRELTFKEAYQLQMFLGARPEQLFGEPLHVRFPEFYA